MTEQLPKAKAKAGWYDHPGLPDTKRYWNGMAWTDSLAPGSTPRDAPRSAAEPPAPDSPYVYVLLGVILGALGGGLIALGVAEDSGAALVAGYVAAGFGWLMSMVGIIGAGVRLGMRHAAYENRTSG